MYLASPTQRIMEPGGHDADRLHMYPALFLDVDPFFDPFVDCMILAMLVLMTGCTARLYSFLPKSSPVHHVVRLCFAEEGTLKW